MVADRICRSCPDVERMKYLLHFLTITKHKFCVLIECFRRGLYWQGIIHDLSKYSPVEFLTSAKYFQGNKTPIGAEKSEKGYSRAWLHHKGHNPHHWEYWVDWRNGEELLCPIPDRYILEMLCDMIGAGKAYGTNNPYKYFLDHKDIIKMEKKSKNKLEQLLKTYRSN